jgi:hypothetical protein
MADKVDWEHYFHNAVYTGKILLVLTLVTLSAINGHKEFVEKNPRSFFLGCLFFAFVMALSSAFIAFNRKGEWQSALFITFLFFFFYAVAREFSGYYALMSGGKERTGNEGKEYKILLPVGIILAACALLGGGFLAYKAGVSPPSPADMRFARFPVELLIFIVLGTVAEVSISLQHGDKSVLGNLANVIIYIIAHLYLQYGGFYDHAFSPVNWSNAA